MDLLPGSFPPATEPIPHDQLMHWRTLVHNDAKNFIAMCRYTYIFMIKNALCILFLLKLNLFVLFRELECVPDVFSLIEWSNWLTPSNYFRRYDTVFYMCCMDNKPLAISDEIEVAKTEVYS